MELEKIEQLEGALMDMGAINGKREIKGKRGDKPGVEKSNI